MIVITGAAGFIGSVLAATYNMNGCDDLVLVDDFGREAKRNNFISKRYRLLVDRDSFPQWLERNSKDVSLVVHLGARTDTTEFNYEVFRKLNVDYTIGLWNMCSLFRIPLIYASSAATYGSGELSYDDNHSLPFSLKPLNEYGRSKNEIDKHVLLSRECPPFWAGLKFFNVYGPNEYHKGRMASVVFHSFNQIKAGGAVKLFRSHRPDFEDGRQLRDFVYVKDVTDVILWLADNRPESGLYNVGTGKARTFIDLVTSTFGALKLKPNIEFVDMPLDIRDKYQYFTEAPMSKLRRAGYAKAFTALEDGVCDYVNGYLKCGKYM